MYEQGPDSTAGSETGLAGRAASHKEKEMERDADNCLVGLSVGQRKMAKQFAKVTGAPLEVAKVVHQNRGWHALGPYSVSTRIYGCRHKCAIDAAECHMLP